MTALLESTEVDWELYREMVPQGTDPTDSESLRMRDAIIYKYLYLTKQVVSKMLKSMPPHVEREDFESLAKIGLMKAVQRYDHTMKVPFQAFVTLCIRSVIMDYIRDQDWVPRDLRKKQRDVTKTEERLRQELGTEPTTAQVAEALNMSVKEVGYTQYKSTTSSPVPLEGCTEAINKSTEDATEQDIAAHLRTALTTGFLALPTREATVVALHYYEKQKLSTIAEIMNISKVKVGQIHSHAVLLLCQEIEKALAEEM